MSLTLTITTNVSIVVFLVCQQQQQQHLTKKRHHKVYDKRDVDADNCAQFAACGINNCK